MDRARQHAQLTGDPNAFSFTSSDPQTISVSITTQGSTASGKQQASSYGESGPLLGGVLLLPVVALGAASKKRRKAILRMALASLALFTLFSCGGGSTGAPQPLAPPLPPPGTTKGTYPITITATPNAGSATTLTLFVTVQ